MPRFVSKRRVDEFRKAFTGEPIDSLVSVYRKASADAIDILSRASNSLASRQRAMALLRQYEEVLTQLNDESAAWIATNIPEAYQAGVAFGDQGAQGVRRAGVNLGMPQRAVFTQVHQEAVQAIVQEMQRTTDVALAQIGRRVNDQFRTLGVRAATQGIVEGKTRVQVSRELKGELLAKSKHKFTDRLGRDWDLDRYTEMVARTTTRQAMTQGTINRLQEHNIELAQVSAHNAADFCIYYENVIVSLTGETAAGYPPLSAINGGPPFHPNCAHVLTPFVLALATEQEQQRGGIEARYQFKSPGQLQNTFRREFPARARKEAKRLRAA